MKIAQFNFTCFRGGEEAEKENNFGRKQKYNSNKDNASDRSKNLDRYPCQYKDLWKIRSFMKTVTDLGFYWMLLNQPVK